MLNQTKVLKYIQYALGVPYSFVEVNDEQIMEIVRLYTLSTFSSFVPDGPYHVPVDTSDPKHQTNEPNVYRFFDPYNRPIISVIDVIQPLVRNLVHEVPLMYGPTKFEQLADWVLKMFKGETAMEYSPLKITFDFIKPNKIKLFTGVQGAPNYFVVVYTREHAEDFSTIPNGLERYFLDLAAADVMEHLDAIRSEYSELNTPFGTIPVRALTDVADKFRTRAMEKLQTIPPVPPLIVG